MRRKDDGARSNPVTPSARMRLGPRRVPRIRSRSPTPGRNLVPRRGKQANQIPLPMNSELVLPSKQPREAIIRHRSGIGLCWQCRDHTRFIDRVQQGEDVVEIPRYGIDPRAEDSSDLLAHDLLQCVARHPDVFDCGRVREGMEEDPLPGEKARTSFQVTSSRSPRGDPRSV